MHEHASNSFTQPGPPYPSLMQLETVRKPIITAFGNEPRGNLIVLKE